MKKKNLKPFFLIKKIEGVLNNLFYRIPLISYRNKQRFVLFIHKKFSFITKYTLSYKHHFNSEQEFDIDVQVKPFNIIPYDPSNISITLNTSDHPTISIIIPVFNQIEFTWRCLKSVSETGSLYPFEIIVVDDCSSDDTSKILSKIQGIKIIHNDKNTGFIRSCNKGAKHSRGSYLVFLNNDIQVLPGWLDELINTFERDNDAGIVGAKLLYPDGKLQEAGGVIFQNGMGLNYGKFDDPFKPEYNYLREVDYCSGSCIMIPSMLFFQLGMFDERYINGYYEDTDLAFSVRKMGKKVFYQPMSRVIHFEGITSGTDVRKGVKAYQVSNGKKFYQKWKHVLKNHISFETKNANLNKHYIKKRLLFIDATTPTPDMDSGSIDSINYMKIFQSFSYQITFIPINNFSYAKYYTQNLQKLGIECLYSPYINSLNEHLESKGDQYDIVLISRVNQAIKSMALIKKYCQKARIIFNPVDLHFLRFQRQAKLLNNSQLDKHAYELKKMELLIAEHSDCTIVLSDIEKKVLLQEHQKLNVEVIPFISNCHAAGNDFEDRNGILFIGNFQHSPNTDAVLYFLDKIWPLIQEKEPDIQLNIIGANPLPQLINKSQKNIFVLGYVKDISTYFNQAKISVVPLRYGAGLKGKIRTSLSYGLPLVSTSIAVEGMNLEHRTHVLIADNEIEFSDSVVELYNNKNLWKKLNSNGTTFVKKNYSIDKCKNKFIEILRNFRKISSPF